MKKWLALLLAVALCFSLMACGGGSSAENGSDSGGDNTLGDGNSSGDGNSPGGTGKDKVTKVELTLDNWQDYLEIKEFFSIVYNAFNEVDHLELNYGLVYRGEGEVIWDGSNVAVDFEYTAQHYKTTLDTGTLTYRFIEPYEGNSTWKNSTAVSLGNCSYLADNAYQVYGCRIFYAGSCRPNQEDDMSKLLDLQMNRIQGTLCIAAVDNSQSDSSGSSGNGSSGNESNSNDTTKDGVTKVELTLDNWQDYLEIKEFVSIVYNAFNEVDHLELNYGLVYRGEGEVVWNGSNVAVDFEYTAQHYKTTLDTGTLTYRFIEPYEGNSTWKSSTVVLLGNCSYLADNEYPVYGCRIFYAGSCRPNQEDDMSKLLDLQMNRIQGTLCISTEE